MAHNPGPRPALRKAPDATVHPAAPVGVEVVAPPAPTRPSHLRPVVGLGGSTSDVLRKAPGKAKGKGGKAAKKKARKREAARHERRVKLKVSVPKEVRTRLRTSAKARGTSVDDVVSSVLEGWAGN